MKRAVMGERQSGEERTMKRVVMGERQFQESLIAFIASLPPEEKKKMRDALVGWAYSGITSWREYYKTLDKENK